MKIFKELEQIVASRKGAPSDGSYTCRLLADKTLAPRKVSEEAYEVCEAALLDDSEGLVQEVADLLYHVIVLLGQKEIRLEEVQKVLEARRQQ